LAFRQEMTNPTSSTPDFGPFIVNKLLDKASVPLAYELATGRIFTQVIIDYGYVVEGHFQLEYQVVLEQARITYIAPEVSQQGDGEVVCFESYDPASSAVTWTYNTYNSAGGLTGTITKTVPWN